jgi:hypothetical protein
MAGKTDDDLQHALEAALKVLGLTQREMAFPHMRPIEKEGDITPGRPLLLPPLLPPAACHRRHCR